MAPSRPRSTAHNYRIGELVVLVRAHEKLDAGDVVQVVGFRGETQLRVRPIGGLPVVAHHALVQPSGLPCGSQKPAHKRRPPRRPRQAQAAAA